MTRRVRSTAPPDAAVRRAVRPVTVYDVHALPVVDQAFYDRVRTGMTSILK